MEIPYSLMGWVQLVRSDENESGGARFEMDPLAFLGDLPHPYCWLGLTPTLFDAPSRSPRVDMDWMAHSFVCPTTSATAWRRGTPAGTSRPGWRTSAEGAGADGPDGHRDS